jgi:hypothetical protein
VGELGAFPIEKDSAAQFLGQGWIPKFVEDDFVFLLDLETGMGHLLGEIAIAGQKEQPFTLCVESSDVEEPGKLCRQQIINRVGGVRIAPGRNKTRGLMQDNRQNRFRPNESMIHFYVVIGFDLGAKIGCRLPVNRDASGRDQLIAMSPRAEPGRGEETVETHEG